MAYITFKKLKHCSKLQPIYAKKTFKINYLREKKYNKYTKSINLYFNFFDIPIIFQK